MIKTSTACFVCAVLVLQLIRVVGAQTPPPSDQQIIQELNTRLVVIRDERETASVQRAILQDELRKLQSELEVTKKQLIDCKPNIDKK